MKIGAIEAGGTKMVCAIGDEKGILFDRIRIETKTPKDTMPQIISYMKENKVEALGLGCFGPIDLNLNSKQYGFITDTPKLAWRHYDILGELEKNLNIPIGIDTDVNGSALGEVTFGCAKQLDSVIYITVGTGIGVGVYVNKKLLHGMLHPEAGHILMRPHPKDVYAGNCPYHKNCLEGLASGPAIEKRYGKKAVDLESENHVWDLEAYYLAQAIVNYIYTYAPQKIILGGGIMHQKQLLPLIRTYVKQFNADYIKTEEMNHLNDYIVLASLNDDQGILGALELGRRAFFAQ